MSAIAHEAPIFERPDRRAHLVLVPTGPDVGRAGGAAATEPPLRLTRLGRLVVAVVIATAVALLGVGLAGQLATAGSALRAVTVVSGDTLSDIAARELPGLPVADGVIEIQLANRLSSTQISAGQALVIPTP
jgi:nucleoid-associated protein YgaU